MSVWGHHQSSDGPREAFQELRIPRRHRTRRREGISNCNQAQLPALFAAGHLQAPGKTCIHHRCSSWRSAPASNSPNRQRQLSSWPFGGCDPCVAAAQREAAREKLWDRIAPENDAELLHTCPDGANGREAHQHPTAELSATLRAHPSQRPASRPTATHRHASKTARLQKPKHAGGHRGVASATRRYELQRLRLLP